MNGHYPAITACLGEARPPSRGEVRRVAARMRREIFSDRALVPAERHFLVRAALTALGRIRR
jgi:hypothetical protein